MHPYRKTEYEQTEYTNDEIEKIKRNSEQMDWSDIVALTLAGLQLLLPMVFLLMISCTVAALLFFLIWG